MSASFCWELVKDSRAHTFDAGTSSDVSALNDTFRGIVSSNQIALLRAMHRATHLKKSLWSEIADTLERLSPNKEVKIKVWAEY